MAEDRQGGRNDALFEAALKLGSYIAGAGLDEQKVIAALEAGRRHRRATPQMDRRAADQGHHPVGAARREAATRGRCRRTGHSSSARDGLLALDLADAVMASVTCGFGYPDQRFYTYDNGVWLPDEDRIRGGDRPAAGQPVPQRAHPQRARPDPATRRTPRASPTTRWPTTSTCPTAWSRGGPASCCRTRPTTARPCSCPSSTTRRPTCPLFEKFLAEVLPPDLLRADRRQPGVHLGADRLHPLLGQPAARRRPAVRQGPQRQGHADPGAQGPARRPQLLHGRAARADREQVPRRHPVRQARQPRR